MDMGAIQERRSQSSQSDGKIVDIQSDDGLGDDPVIAEAISWNQVQRNRRKNHVELKDLSEENFLQLIDFKNQDKRFYGWLNFEPMLHEFEPHDPVVSAHKRLLDAEDHINFFIDLQNMDFEVNSESSTK
jgi:hypothetical protein